MSGLIEIEALTLRRDGRDVLRGVELTLAAGERLAIVGANGSGKTTLLRCLVGLEPPQEGRVTLFGTPCRREAEFRAARPRIGFLFQDSDDQLICPSVIEDVAFGPLNLGARPEDARRRAEAALAQLDLTHLADRFTHRLSGGEKRLVCLAGLLAMRPDVLLLDEPTNGVDTENGRKLRAALMAFDGAMILVSHDDGFVAEIATRAAVLHDGRLHPAHVHTHPHLHSHPHIHED
ncbi:energy-coupling factor ABC transporter ATP-binding protein [Phaeovulum vinaykumarii]|uniref:Cobalt/nickel transport system ATP-binding protein n=1 Tax=Phaeovulum vinaykumarii TaxID=407234 RepID=A0A1N7MET5_9RHOB|nr:ABC transporter ATP-binding protein [Phaeovulum vinaykumarii]SIS84636.1 cobalt/nickel transport system ATP-binding protein [Phaeovulum vinaykumarii]SOC11869.1 cobalt/nickel transport system ATP-binding protein [Phaeovulum vinaykumarii]